MSLCTTLLMPLAYLTDSVSMKIPFLSLFWSCVEGLFVLGSSPLCTANRVSDPKISVSNPSYLSLMFPWMEVDSEIYDRWLWTTHNWGQQLLYFMYQKCSATKLSHPNVICYKIKLAQNLIMVIKSGRWAKRNHTNLG